VKLPRYEALSLSESSLLFPIVSGGGSAASGALMLISFKLYVWNSYSSYTKIFRHIVAV
jgi:hypothetical protein